MKFYSVWQPARAEDPLTALSFGFLRHAPAEHGLSPWLSWVLKRPASASGLLVTDFWPTHLPAVGPHVRTEPDLAVVVDDGQPLLVLVEAKLGFGGHDFDQIRREVTDAATYTGQTRIELVMVGADRGAPAATLGWEARLVAELTAGGLDHVHVRLRYCSWARVGHFIKACAAAERAPEWQTYASDVLHQMRERGLLGYNGGPMTSDLKGLTVANAIRLFNRTVAEARLLLLDLIGTPRFSDAGLAPSGGRSFWMGRDAYSTALGAEQDNFTVTLLLFCCRKPSWPPGTGAFVAFDLDRDDGPHLQAGAYHCTQTGPQTMAWAYANASADVLVHSALITRDRDALPLQCSGGDSEWVLDEHPWPERDADSDLTWTLDRLDAAAHVWDGAEKTPPGA